MPLDGPLFTWLVRLIGLAVAVWIVWRWPRSAEHTPWAIVRRIVSLVMISLMVILNLVIPINAYYAWYSSWTDLWRAITGTSVVEASDAPVGAPPRDAINTTYRNSPLAALPTTPSAQPTGTATAFNAVRMHRVEGPNHTGDVAIWLPPTYTNNPTTSYPVVMALHGAPGSWDTIMKGLGTADAINALTDDNAITPPIVVMPIWTFRGADTGCTNGKPAGPDIETWLTRDVPTWVATHFRVKTDRQSWATMGLSAGGYCAMMLPMRHPELFSAGINLAGYNTPSFDPHYKPFGPSDAKARDYDMLSLAATRPPAVALWILAPKPDRVTFPPSIAITKAAKAPLSVTLTQPDVGGHRMDVWTPYVPVALEWLAKHSPGFAPAANA